jgi:HEAT repeat protein
VYRKKWVSTGGGGIQTPHDAEILETQSPTNHGDSGGPLVNDRGELVGVTQGVHSEAHLFSIFISLNEARDYIEREYLRKFAKPWAPVARAPLRIRGGGGADVTALINALDHKEAKNRASAAKSLGDMGPDAKLAVRRLIKALKDPDELTSRTAADALTKIGAPGRDDLPALIEALKDQKPDVRRYASGAIGQIGPDAASAAGPLAEALSDEDERVRESLVRALGSLGPAAKAAAVPGLTKALQDNGKSVRVAAAAAMANLMTPPKADDVPLLVTILKQKDPEGSVFGARGLAKLGKQAKDAIPALVEVAKAGDTGVRREAIEALAAVGPDAKTAGPLYVAALKDASADSAVRQSALLALGQLGKDLEKDKETVAAVLDAVKDTDKQVKKAALAAVGKLGPVVGAPGAKQVMPTVIDFLQDSDAGLRDQAFETVAGLGPLARDAVNPLINIMEKKDVKLYVKQQGGKPFMQEADEQFLDKIAKTLGKIGQPAVKRLLTGLNTTNINVGLIVGSCRALGEIGPPAKEAIPTLQLLSTALPSELGAEADRAMRKIRK